jgi:hypothetical protein
VKDAKGRVRALLVVGAVVAALVVLQVPPLDGWRYRTLLTWQPTQSATQVSGAPRSTSPPVDLPVDVPIRVEWCANAPVHDTSEGSPPRLLIGADDGREATLFGGSWAVTSAAWSRRRIVADDTVTDTTTGSPSRWLYLKTGSTHGRALLTPYETRDPGGGSAPGYRLVFVSSGSEQPQITFELSRPYGYLFSVPIEDYILAAALVALLAWLPLRHIRRRHIEVIPE